MFLTRIAVAVIIILTTTLFSQHINGQKRESAETASLTEIGSGIGRSEADFAKRARSAGFGKVETKDDDGLTLIRMSGRLGSQRKCILLTATNKENGRKILHASLFLPERGSWADLKADYEGLKESLTKAYGTPKDCSESVPASLGEDSKAIMSAVKADKVDYTTKFEKGGLTIMLSITYTAEHGAHAGILFIDKAVSENILSSIGGDMR
ncbi:MAG: hypothetical protein ACI35Q_07620 [Marinilabiliaceae bacterium]